MKNMTSSVSNEMFEAASKFLLDDSWQTCTGKGVSVAIIDSGVDANHSDLKGKVKKTYEAKKDGKKSYFC